MDNKVTKRRLSNFLAYEWILVVVVVIAAIFVWELIYSITGVGLTVGQRFNYYYDTELQRNDMIDFHATLGAQDGTNNHVLSYDVILCEYEKIYSDNDVLSSRLEIQEADVIFTDIVGHDSEKQQTIRLHTLVDKYGLYDFASLLNDATDYLSQFLKAEHSQKTIAEKRAVVLSEGYVALDEAKIENHFLTRMKKDNRFRRQAQKQVGVVLEKERFAKLCAEVKDFNTILNCGQDIFYNTYTKYTQVYQEMVDVGNKEYIDFYKPKLDQEIEYEKTNPKKIYGIKLENLVPDDYEENVSKYFRLYGKSTAENVVLSVFNFKDYQPDLQFETIAFVNNVVRQFSNII